MVPTASTETVTGDHVDSRVRTKLTTGGHAALNVLVLSIHFATLI